MNRSTSCILKERILSLAHIHSYVEKCYFSIQGVLNYDVLMRCGNSCIRVCLLLVAYLPDVYFHLSIEVALSFWEGD